MYNPAALSVYYNWFDEDMYLMNNHHFLVIKTTTLCYQPISVISVNSAENILSELATKHIVHTNSTIADIVCHAMYTKSAFVFHICKHYSYISMLPHRL